MAHTTYQQTRDQVAHFAAALLPVVFFILLPTVAAFTALGAYMGLIRELSQHNTLNPSHLGRGSVLDIIFWTLGGFAAGLIGS